MSSPTTRRAAPSRGGLAGLVSRFENLDSSPKSRSKSGEAQKTRGRPSVAPKVLNVSSFQRGSKGPTTEIPRSVTSPSLTAGTASFKRGIPKTPVKERYVGDAVAPSPTGDLRTGSVVAQRRKLFERGLTESVAPTASHPATYEPKRVPSPAPINDKASSTSSSSKTSSILSEAGDVARSDLQEERDVVPDLITPTSQVEHPEYLPPPLVSSRPSSRNQQESEAGEQAKKGAWQRSFSPRVKLQGGIFLDKPPSPLKNMVVTDVGDWHPKPCPTKSDKALQCGDSSARTKLRRSSLEPDQTEALDVQSDVTLCYPCHEAVLSSSASDLLQALHGRNGTSMPAPRSNPSPQSKVSNLRAKFDSELPSSVSMPSVSKRRSQTDAVNGTQTLLRDNAPKTANAKTPLRPSSAIQVSLRPTARYEAPKPPQRGTSPTKPGTLKEKIGLFESRCRQDEGGNKSKQAPRTSVPSKFSRAVTKKAISASQRQDHGAFKTFDGPPPPLLSPAENGPRRSYNRSPAVDSVSSQASNARPLLYDKPSLLKPNRQMKNLGAIIRSDWRRRIKGSSDDEQRSVPAQLQVYNVDGEGGATFEQQAGQEIVGCPGAWPDEDGDDASPTAKQRPGTVSRHPSLRLLRRRLISRSQGLFFVSQARCVLEQPQPVRGREIRRLTSLCRERMAALRARAQTE